MRNSTKRETRMEEIEAIKNKRRQRMGGGGGGGGPIPKKDTA